MHALRTDICNVNSPLSELLQTLCLALGCFVLLCKLGRQKFVDTAAVLAANTAAAALAA